MKRSGLTLREELEDCAYYFNNRKYTLNLVYTPQYDEYIPMEKGFYNPDKGWAFQTEKGDPIYQWESQLPWYITHSLKKMADKLNTPIEYECIWEFAGFKYTANNSEIVKKPLVYIRLYSVERIRKLPNFIRKLNKKFLKDIETEKIIY